MGVCPFLVSRESLHLLRIGPQTHHVADASAPAGSTVSFTLLIFGGVVGQNLRGRVTLGGLVRGPRT
jgi:hypothetical protein